jgi:hypothetical protein
VVCCCRVADGGAAVVRGVVGDGGIGVDVRVVACAAAVDVGAVGVVFGCALSSLTGSAAEQPRSLGLPKDAALAERPRPWPL